MDPVTHTFVGAVMGETRLRQTTAYSGLTLIVAANLPDIDGITYFLGQDASLYWRRGWSHGVLAMLLLPLLWAGAVAGLARLRGRQAEIDARWIVALSYMGVLSHPALDWLNNYGVRLLMPFNGTWYYGDALFIADPWVWMLLGGFLFLRRSRRSSLPVLGWTLFALVATALVFLGPGSQLPLRLVWMAGLAALVLLDWFRPAWVVSPWAGPQSSGARKKGRAGGGSARMAHGKGPASKSKLSSSKGKRNGRQGHDSTHGPAAYAPLAVLAALLIYISASLALTSWSEAEAIARMGGQDVEKVMASPVPLNPLIRDVVIQTQAGYRYGRLHPLNQPPLNLASRLIPKLPRNDPRVQRAIRQPEVRGMVNWARFPWALVQRGQDSDLVYLMDARYVRSATTGFGGAMVELEAER